MSGDPRPDAIELRRPSASDIAALRDVLGVDGLLTAADDLARFEHDETESLRFAPDAAALPRDVEQVQAVLRIAHAARVPVVPRGAGTGLSGGALAVRGGIVLTLGRMNRIRAIDLRDQVAEVEAGVTTAEIERRAAEHGLFYPPDPASKETCQIGGNIAEDSAGPRSCKYGSTRKWVLGLEAVLADGTLVRTGSRCRKDASGYDLTQLLVGSEGTLAVVTAATLRLAALPRATLTAIAPFTDLRHAAAAVEFLFTAGIDPAACELLERAALAAAARIETLPQPLVGAEAMLLVELDGDDPEALLARAQRLEAITAERGAGALLIADDAAGQRRLWQVRRCIGEAVKALSPYKEADTVVPRSRLAELVEAARSAAARHGLTTVVYGHAGDGNLHVNLLRGDLDDDDAWTARRDAAEEELFRRVVDLGGRITGEHGIGWVQRRYLSFAHSPAQIELLRAIKHAFDPRGILNPDKVLP